MPSTLSSQRDIITQPLHTAIIMDGNGRWASRRGLPRSAGHIAGGKRLRTLISTAPDLGITKLTLFAFSADNWRRPKPEVAAIMSLLDGYLDSEVAQLITAGVQLTFIGRRDRLAHALVAKIQHAEHATKWGARLRLRIALDYSSRSAITQAAANLNRDQSTPPEALERAISQSDPTDNTPCEVDLLIRTGGEKRLSDFLLWESAYAELCFSDKMFPDFTVLDLRSALTDFKSRDRRFGGLSRVA
jgi:undecaprenyl diphosphate synthase